MAATRSNATAPGTRLLLHDWTSPHKKVLGLVIGRAQGDSSWARRYLVYWHDAPPDQVYVCDAGSIRGWALNHERWVEAGSK
jgi:hypothetical protein